MGPLRLCGSGRGEGGLGESRATQTQAPLEVSSMEVFFLFEELDKRTRIVFVSKDITFRLGRSHIPCFEVLRFFVTTEGLKYRPKYCQPQLFLM